MNYQNNKTETSVIQLALKRAGFLDGEIDGIFGSDTRNAVISFQKAASLSPDGIVGPKTYAALLPYLKGYTIHRVKKGDSLYSIAAMHNTSIRKILLANPTVKGLFGSAPTAAMMSGFLTRVSAIWSLSPVFLIFWLATWAGR